MRRYARSINAVRRQHPVDRKGTIGYQVAFDLIGFYSVYFMFRCIIAVAIRSSDYARTVLRVLPIIARYLFEIHTNYLRYVIKVSIYIYTEIRRFLILFAISRSRTKKKRFYLYIEIHVRRTNALR